MHSVADAQDLIDRNIVRLAARDFDIDPKLLGLALAENILAARDSPPFDKAMMDGFAVRSADGAAELAVIEEVMAGQVPTKSIQVGEATRIMTGAPMPTGADAVVMVERTTMLGPNRVRLGEAARPGQNVFRRGGEMRGGEAILLEGVRLTPAQIGLIAAVGRSRVSAFPRPEVAVIPTGDEIVDLGMSPGPGQIRNSNGAMLLAQVERAGGVARWIGIARDNEPHLRSMISAGLESDAIVLSGGVSAGVADLVPKVLADLGMETLVQKVRLKPGKPMLFGKVPRSGQAPVYVFGLPGNPVSSFVCFELFVRPALRRLMGQSPGPRLIEAELVEATAYRTDRPTYHPAHLEMTEKNWRVRRLPWLGSPDLRGLAAANALMLFPEGDHSYAIGSRVAVLPLE